MGQILGRNQDNYVCQEDSPKQLEKKNFKCSGCVEKKCCRNPGFEKEGIPPIPYIPGRKFEIQILYDLGTVKKDINYNFR